MLGLRIPASCLPRSTCRLRRFNVLRSYSSSSETDIESLLSKPSWSVRSLRPDSATEASSSPSVTPKQLHHLLRLSALAQPTSAAEEQSMLKTLEAQIHFVKEIQRVDAAGVTPLQSIRDESSHAVEEDTIGLEQLKDALSRERVHGRRHRIHRMPAEKNEHPDGNTWDGKALEHASKTKGPFFVVETPSSTNSSQE